MASLFIICVVCTEKVSDKWNSVLLKMLFLEYLKKTFISNVTYQTVLSNCSMSVYDYERKFLSVQQNRILEFYQGDAVTPRMWFCSEH